MKPPFDQAWRHSERGLYAYAQTMTNNPDKTADLLQETRIKAWTSYERFDGRATFYTWVRGIMRNAWADETRLLRSRRPDIPFNDARDGQGYALAETLTDGFPRFVDRIVSAESIPRMSDYEMSMLFNYIDGMTHEKQAKSLGLSVPAFKSKLHRLRYRLYGEMVGAV